MSGWLAIKSLSVYMWKSHKHSSVSYPDLGTSRPFLAKMFLYTMPDTWLWCPCVLASCTRACLHSLHLGFFLEWKTPTSIDLVLRPCSFSAMIRASVLSFSPALSSHWSDFSISAASSICWGHTSWTGLSSYDVSSSFSSSFSGFCCLRNSPSTWWVVALCPPLLPVK